MLCGNYNNYQISLNLNEHQILFFKYGILGTLISGFLLCFYFTFWPLFLTKGSLEDRLAAFEQNLKDNQFGRNRKGGLYDNSYYQQEFCNIKCKKGHSHGIEAGVRNSHAHMHMTAHMIQAHHTCKRGSDEKETCPSAGRSRQSEKYREMGEVIEQIRSQKVVELIRHGSTLRGSSKFSHPVT